VGILNISDIKPGMKLAAPVLNQKGLLLLPEGTTLTEKHFFILESWGITEANIDGVSTSGVMLDISMLDPGAVNALDNDLQLRFPNNIKESDVMSEILRITRKIKLDEMLLKLAKKKNKVGRDVTEVSQKKNIGTKNI